MLTDDELKPNFTENITVVKCRISLVPSGRPMGFVWNRPTQNSYVSGNFHVPAASCNKVRRLFGYYNGYTRNAM